jgi:hypothetical protein
MTALSCRRQTSQSRYARERRDHERTFCFPRDFQRSASFFISLYCLISPLTPFLRLCWLTDVSVAFSSSAAALS